MISASMGTFFWLSSIYMYLKYNFKWPDYYHIFFFLILIIFMYVINITIIQSKCNSSMSVVTATFVPWLLIFGSTLVALSFFPEWKRPFSNTFGYVFARLAGSTAMFLDLLKQDQKISYIYEDPSLLLNQFTTTNFDTMFETMKEVFIDDLPKKELFKNVVGLKEIISEWIWILLAGSIAISSSYTILMNTECTKSSEDYLLQHNIAMAETDDIPEPTLYTVTS